MRPHLAGTQASAHERRLLGKTLKDLVDQLASCPLRFQPGTEWCYSNATDVLGYLIEVVSGLSLPEFFQQRIFAPLGMTDTGFHVPADKRDRFAACYTVPAGMSIEADGFRQETGYQRLENEEVRVDKAMRGIGLADTPSCTQPGSTAAHPCPRSSIRRRLCPQVEVAWSAPWLTTSSFARCC